MKGDNKMKKVIKNILTIMLCTSLIALSGCNKWARVDNIQTINMIEMSANQELLVFNKNGKYQGILEDNNVSVSDALNLTKGIFKKKGGIKQAGENIKKANQERVDNELKTRKRTMKFHSDMKKNVIKSLDNIFTLNNSKEIKNIKYQDFKGNKRLVKKLIKQGRSDGVLAVGALVGVIKKKAAFGLSEKYELVSKVKFQIADKKGFIGQKELFVRSGVVKQSSGAVPLFTEQDFANLFELASSEINSELEILKI